VAVQLAGLTTHVIEKPNARGAVVLMHGFGAPGDDLVALGEVLDVPTRFIFPEAPLVLGGLYGDSRAWWPLDLARLEAELRAGTLRDRRAEVPEGLAAVRDQVSRLVDEVKTRYGLADNQVALGGFSQGAMLALDVALHRGAPPAAVVVLSGTIVSEAEWQPRFATLARVPVFQSHGRNDFLLPFVIAEQLRDQLRAAGAALDWNAFAGGHEIPPPVLAALREFLAARTSG
jgi:phospholipase/carboxylesterase